MKPVLCQDTGELCRTYFEYLRSRHWWGVKARYKKKHTSCELCGEKQGLEIHHKTYQDIGDELDSQLILLCRSCHQISHDMGGELEANSYLLELNAKIKAPKKEKKKRRFKFIPKKERKKKKSKDPWIEYNKKNGHSKL